MATARETEEMLAHGVELFNTRYFFEAHEVLEDVWLLDRTPSRRFFQGLIQISSAYHHLANGNHRGALDLLVRGSEKLRPYLPTHLGVDLADLLDHVSRDAEAVRDLQEGRPQETPIEPPTIRLVQGA